MPRWEANLSSDLKGKRVGIPREYRIDGVPAEINALWDQGIEWLKDAGTVGITGSASTAEGSVQELIQALHPDSVEELTAVEENVFFNLPPELR